jgi:hypothetical protein
MNRRDALKLLATGTAAAAAIPATAKPAAARTLPVLETPATTPPAQARATGPRGTPADPDLLRPKPHWDNVLTADELATLAVLCDIIIPADDRSPAASTVGAHNYINEHVSAPYDGQRRDLVTVRGGLVWLDTESGKRFGTRFRDAAAAQQIAICEDIHYAAEAQPEFRAGARFFSTVRNLTATAFYTTAEGMRDLRFMGNTPSPTWNGPPPEVLRHIGLAGGE